jgi:ABC-type lipoprotein export system ATPase subunit
MFLQIDKINKSYQAGSTGRARVVLDDLSLRVADGEAIAIVGPSGSGKTTLLNQIGTMDKPDNGNIFFRGRDIGLQDSKALEEFRNQEIGFIFQQHHLLPQCTLLENVLLPSLPGTKANQRSQVLERARVLLERVDLWDLRDQKPGELSGGECQRTAVVRSLINNPSLLLADEPTGALDTDNAQNLADLLLDFNRSDKLVLIVVTHSMELAAKMDKIYLLKNGRLEPTV